MKKLMTLFAFVLVAFTANAQSTLKGDVNGDGEVNVTDVTMIVEHVLGQNNSSFIVANADVNGDGSITVTDVAEAVNIILDGNGGDNNGSGNGSGIGDTSQAYLTCPNNNHPHMIDLGLPSGTRWACCNVGADKPEAYGGYYAWGETEEKRVYNDVTYQHCTGEDTDGDGMYDDGCVWQSLDYQIAGTQYDVAHVQWGGSWVMPSHDQQVELLDNCTYEWAKKNGVEGIQFTGPNGGTIFLPASGFRMDDHIRSVNWSGRYWSSTRHTPYGSRAYIILIYTNSPSASRTEWERIVGLTVRPVSR